MADVARWYVVHTYSGYENTVKATIEKTIESRHLQDVILAISIPMETVTEITESGTSKTYERKVYPGYVLVKMVYSDNTWHVIRNIRGVTGFVGTSSNDPTPLTDEEVYAMGVEKKEIIVNYEVGDTVRILDGPLSSFTGVVESIEVEKNAVSVIVSIPVNASGRNFRSERGRGAKPRKKCALRIITTFYSGGAYNGTESYRYYQASNQCR